ncbi:MAG: hypothetical protein J6Z80_00990 [Clostridia bacterium]|nr:hypothetical protein [Clostridia bacterium]
METDKRNITIIDETLCDKSNVLLFREKTAVAKKADGFGADIVLMPPMTGSKEDEIIVKTISSALSRAKIAVRATNRDETAAASPVVAACRGIILVDLPTSPATMEYSYHVKDEGMTKIIKDLVSLAGENGAKVGFCASDATRTETSALVSFCLAAKEAGASFIVLSDDACEAFAEDLNEIILSVIENTGDTPVYFRTSNKLGLGLSLAVDAIRSGASGVFCDALGKTVPVSDLSELLRSHGERLGVVTGLNFTVTKNDVKSVVEILSGGVRKDETPGSAGTVLLDENSDPGQIRAAAETLGYELSEDDLGQVCAAVGRVCVKKGTVGVREFEALIASSARQVPSTYHVESYTVTSGNMIGAMAHVVLTNGDGRVESVAYGDGPIDSAFHALEQCVGLHFELDDFQIQAVTEGREALGSAIVRLRSDGVLYSGNGISTDIVGASIRAYVNALNKIVFEGGK